MASTEQLDLKYQRCIRRYQLAGTVGASYAEDSKASLLPIEQRVAGSSSAVVEGRQAAPVATSTLSTAERSVIDHTADRH